MVLLYVVLNGYYIHTEHDEILYLFSKRKQHTMMCDMCKTSVQNGFLCYVEIPLIGDT